MRQITCDAVDAFVNGRRFKRANTEVRGKGYYLHGHKIAWYDFSGRLWISNCGYQNGYNKRASERIAKCKHYTEELAMVFERSKMGW